MSETHRFFVALLPPQEIQDYADQVRQHFADHYASCHAQKSPPHITLQPPFQWSSEKFPKLEQALRGFAEKVSSVPIVLDNFSAFPPRVIYINVLKTPELLTLQKQLVNELESSLGIVDPVTKSRPFAPHITVAFRDLTQQNFHKSWQEFEQKSLHFEFVSDRLTLLIHNGQRWTVAAEFPFLA